MAEVRPIRHQTDFQVVPRLYHNDKAAFGQIMMGEPEAFLARVYTQVLEGAKTSRWSKVKKYKASDFRATKTVYPGCTLVWVELPPKEDGSHVWATAYAVVIPELGQVSLYQVEQSVFGTSCIGSVDAQGGHVNHGAPGANTQQTVGLVLKLALGRDPREEPPRPEPEKPEIRWPEEPKIQWPPEPEKPKEEPKPEPKPEPTTVRWEPRSLQDELLHTVFSCSSAPVSSDLDDRARWLMEKIRYFRDGGIGEEDLYVLEKKILEFMPDFVCDNFEEYLGCLAGDLTGYCEYVESLQQSGRWDQARKLLEPMVDHIQDNDLSSGLYLRNALERAMWILEYERPFDRELISTDYSRPLLLKARCCLQDGDRWGAIALLEEATELAPCSSGVCEVSAEAKLHPEDRLDTLRWMLTLCTDKDALVRAYRRLGEIYLELERRDVAGALLALIRKLGGKAPELEKALEDAAPVEDWAAVLGSCGICVGFSDLVKEAARFLEDPRAGEIREAEVRRSLRAIRMLEL